MSVEHSFERCFPFPTPRIEQIDAIRFALDAFLTQNKQFVILELGTGIGKSAIGVTIARYLNGDLNTTGACPTGAYVLTTQKVLQEQYVRDFGPDATGLLRSIKSSSNYTCTHFKDQNCGESRRVLSKLTSQLSGTEFFKNCRTFCPYMLDKAAFIESPLSITNFSYFLAETLYSKKLEPRDLLIIDEAHNIESELSKFIEVTFSERFARDVLKCKLPRSEAQEDVVGWMKGPYLKAVSKHIAGLEKALKSSFSAGMAGFGTFSKQYEMLDKHLCKVNRFINSYDPENWVMNIVRQPGSGRAGRRFEFKPIDVGMHGHDMLYRFGTRVLMMSATIVDKDLFCKRVGIAKDKVAFLHMPSPFPAANRPIHFFPVGSMSAKAIDTTLPLMVEAVKTLLEQHHDEKGIIHCVNYRVAKHLFDNVRSDRLLMHDGASRERVLKEHVAGSRPTVILSPSMMEGVDLADDASRFQILCKVPFPYLGDAMVKKRMLRDRSWYDFQTAKSVIQSMGRSVRNMEDHARSYILDADWEGFLRRNSQMFPKDFLDLFQSQ